MIHNSISGVAHFIESDDVATLNSVRDLLSYYPSNNLETAPFKPTNDDPNRLIPELDTHLPDNVNKPHDMYAVIRAIADDGIIKDVMPHYAKNVITCYIRLNGEAVGVIASQQ